jgi:hypothetical protein
MADILYVGQTSVDFTITTDVDITGSTCLLKYQGPNGSPTGNLSGSISDASSGIFTAAISTDILTVAGKWTFWAYVTFSDARVAAGRPFKIEVREEGT